MSKLEKGLMNCRQFYDQIMKTRAMPFSRFPEIVGLLRIICRTPKINSLTKGGFCFSVIILKLITPCVLD